MGQKSVMVKTKKPLFCTALSACILLGILSGCTAGTEEEEDTIVQIEQPEETSSTLVVVSTDDVVKTGKLWCVYKQTEEEEVSIPYEGRTVAWVYVEKGDTVAKGQLLVELVTESDEDTIDELEYKIARNTLLLGYTDVDENSALSARWWTYVYQSSGSESDWENLQASLESIRQTYRYKREDYQDAIDLDRLRLEEAKKELSESRIYADMDGEVSFIKSGFERGSLTAEGEAVIKIIDSSKCILVSDKGAGRYLECFHEGEAMTLSMNISNRIVEAQVIPYDMEHWEDIFYFEFQEEKPSNVQVGQGGNLTFTLDSREGVLALPLRAVHKAKEGNYVYVLGENDIREVKWIETGLWGDSLVEIVSGLEEGEYVVLK